MDARPATPLTKPSTCDLAQRPDRRSLLTGDQGRAARSRASWCAGAAHRLRPASIRDGGGQRQRRGGRGHPAGPDEAGCSPSCWASTPPRAFFLLPGPRPDPDAGALRGGRVPRQRRRAHRSAHPASTPARCRPPARASSTCGARPWTSIERQTQALPPDPHRRPDHPQGSRSDGQVRGRRGQGEAGQLATSALLGALVSAGGCDHPFVAGGTSKDANCPALLEKPPRTARCRRRPLRTIRRVH